MSNSNATTGQVSQPTTTLATPQGNATQVSARLFLDDILPPLDSRADVDALIQRNPPVPRKFGKLITTGGRLWGFPKNPSKSRRLEKAAYKNLDHVAASIAQEGSKQGFKRVVEFTTNATGDARIGRRQAGSFPDAYFLVRKDRSDGVVGWPEVAVCGEYRKNASLNDERENIAKVVQSMRNCMHLDPRRRFTYGFTMEDTRTRLWYSDRSQILVSEPFNFTEEHHFLVHFFLSIMFAEAHQLGWDPTMKSFADGRIEIAVQSENDGEELYRTINLLSDIGSADLIGRGTRVWKAVKMVNGEEFGEPVALKDSWVDYNRKREGAIHERIRESILATAQAELFTRHFLTVECYGDVLVLDEQDRTRPPQDHSLSSSPELAVASIHTSEYHQVHHRIVFKEVGLPLSKVTSLLEVFNALGDVVDGLRCLHECGWVHRDISTGNVVIVDGIAKITDLEYATSDDETVKVGKTGTIFFRPVEVDGPSYMFLPPPKLPPPSRPIDRKARMARWAASYDDPSLPPPALRKRSPRQEEPKAPRISKYGNLVFRYNPLHDLESVWWMAVYFVFNREVDIDDDGADTETRRVESQRQFARELFYEAIPRLRVIASECFFESHLDCLHPSIAPIGEILEDARIELVAGYRRAEEEIQTIGRHAANGLHAELKQQFLIIANQLRINDLPLRRFNERTFPGVIPAVDAVIEARDL